MSKLSHGQLGGWLECGRTGDHFKDMTIDLAGEAADRIFSNGDPSPPTWARPDREKVGPTHDLESACTYAAKLPGDPNEQLAKAWARAVELVQKHRATITALAAKLEHQGELSGSEVKTFLHERLRAKPKKAMPKASAPAVMQTLQRTDGYIRRSQPTWDDSIPGGGIFQARRP